MYNLLFIDYNTLSANLVFWFPFFKQFKPLKIENIVK
jgi:hypothetical protein